jgi:tol-pal system protein YbgF
MKRLIVLVPFLLSGCFFPADRGRIVEGRLDTLTEENQKLRDALKETQARLDKTTTQLQEALEQLDTASRTTGANIGVKVDTAIQDVAQLRGQVESDQHRMIELEGRLAEVDVKLSSQAATAAKPDKPDGKGEPAKAEEKKPDNAKDFLKLAEDKAKAGDTETARRLFTELMRKWPKDDLAGEAHFALGETYYTDKKCREALYEYGKVLADFAKTRSAPSAYLRSSECFKELKMGAESKLALEELVKQHPKSDAAKTAKQRLAELEKPEKKKGK